MATANATELRALLGKTVVLSEVVHGFEFERRGVVTAVLETVPGSRHQEAILLEEDGKEPEFYHQGDYQLLHIE